LKDVYEEQLKNYDFIFAHASYVVNYDYVTAIRHNCLHIKTKGGPTSLPISRNKKDEARNRHIAILRRRRGI